MLSKEKEQVKKGDNNIHTARRLDGWQWEERLNIPISCKQCSISRSFGYYLKEKIRKSQYFREADENFNQAQIKLYFPHSKQRGTPC